MTTYEAVMQQLQQKKFAPVYLLMGEEPFFIDQVADFIEENAIDASQRDFNQFLVYGKDITGGEVVALCREVPFGSPYRVIIVKEAKNLKNIDLLCKYAEKPSPQTVLVLCHKYGKLKAKQYMPFDKSGVVMASDKIKDYKLEPWVEQRAKDYGYNISRQIASVLAEQIGNDLSRIDNEFKKLKVVFAPGTEITTDIVEKYIGISKEYNIFELQNALAARDLNKVYKITYNFCNHLKENPNPATINGLASFYGKMLAFHFSDRSAESLTKIFGNLPPFILQTKAQEANRFSIIELKRNISLLREYDAKCKGVNSVLEDAELLKELIYSLTH